MLPTQGATERRTKRGDVIPAESFEEDGVDIWEVVAVLGSREAIVSNDGVDLGLGSFLLFRVTRKTEEEGLDNSHSLLMRQQYFRVLVLANALGERDKADGVCAPCVT